MEGEKITINKIQKGDSVLIGEPFFGIPRLTKIRRKEFLYPKERTDQKLVWRIKTSNGDQFDVSGNFKVMKIVIHR